MLCHQERQHSLADGIRLLEPGDAQQHLRCSCSHLADASCTNHWQSEASLLRSRQHLAHTCAVMASRPQGKVTLQCSSYHCM